APVNGATFPSAALAHDTGASSSDGITQDPSISGEVTGANGIADLRAGLDGALPASFVSIAATLQPEGTFQLTREQLDGLAGGTLDDGPHTLHILAVDTAGNTTPFDVAFTLDTTAPAAPVFDLAVTDQVGDPFDNQTRSSRVTLVGKTEPNDTLALLSTGATTISSNTGAFQFANVDVAPGNNTFTVQVTDEA